MNKENDKSSIIDALLSIAHIDFKYLSNLTLFSS